MGTCLAFLLDPGCASRTKRDPEQSQIRYQLATGYFRDQRVEAAIEELQKALQADPDNADAYNMLGIIALRQGHDYVAQLEAASCLKGKDAELVRSEAQAKFKDAGKNLRKAVELRPEFPEAWNNLSVAESQLRSWDEAVTAAQNALKDAAYATPELARANLGWAYYQKKDFQSAWKELHEAVSRAPGFCVARYRLAKVYVVAKSTRRRTRSPRCSLMSNGVPSRRPNSWAGCSTNANGRWCRHGNFFSVASIWPREVVSRMNAGAMQS